VYGIGLENEIFGIEPAETFLMKTGSAGVSANVEDVVIRHGYVYVAAGQDGIEVFDGRTPGSITPVGGIPFAGTVTAVEADNGLVCFATGGQTFGVHRIDPDTTVTIELPFAQTTAVAVDSNVAYVASRNRQWNVVGLDNPVSPINLGSLPALKGSGEDVLVGEGVMFVVTSNRYAGGENGIAVYDTQFPTFPIAVTFLSLPVRPVTAALAGTSLYVALGKYGLAVFDVSDPANPLRVGELVSRDAITGVAVAGGRLFVADGEGGLYSTPSQECPEQSFQNRFARVTLTD
jgi:hypothetical protein